MKTNLLKAFAIAIAMISFYNCSVEPAENFTSISDTSITELEMQTTESEALVAICSGANPKSRITNNGTVPFDYQIYDATGTFIIGIYNISPGTVTQWTDFSEGTIIFNVENGTDVDQKVAYLMENCTEINLEIDANNLLTAAVPQPSTD